MDHSSGRLRFEAEDGTVEKGGLLDMRGSLLLTRTVLFAALLSFAPSLVWVATADPRRERRDRPEEPAKKRAREAILLLRRMARQEEAVRRYDDAERDYRGAVELLRQAVGEQHPDYLAAVNSLASFMQDVRGDFRTTELLYRKAIEMAEKAKPVPREEFATSLHGLGLLYKEKGDLSGAEPLLRQAADIRKAALGEASVAYAASLKALGSCYRDLGDYSKAEPLYHKALAIQKKALGEYDPVYCATLASLANLYGLIGEQAKAVPLLEMDVTVQRKTGTLPDLQTALNNLGLACYKLHDFARAQTCLEESYQLAKKLYSPRHPGFAVTAGNLANVYLSRRMSEKAVPLLRDCVENFRRDRPGSLELASVLTSLAIVSAQRQELGAAAGAAREALELTRMQLEKTAAIQSENQQLRFARSLRFTLDLSLIVLGATGCTAEVMYAHVLAWKGTVTERQYSIRRAVDDPQAFQKAVQLQADLAGATRQLSRLYQIPNSATGQGIKESQETLSQRVESLERELAGISASYRTMLEARRRTPADIQRTLPPDVALVDWLECEWTSGRHLLAFVVRHDHGVEFLDLGDVTPIASAIRDCRRAVAQRLPLTGEAGPGMNLRHLVWEPIEKYLGDATTVLVSPDGATARFPWGALPGKAPAAYLIEERAVAVVPVPRLLPDLLSRAGRPTGEGSLLLVGGVDFEADPVQVASIRSGSAAPGGSPVVPDRLRNAASKGRGGAGGWPPLESTADEVRRIRALFASRFPKAPVAVLTGAGATEEAVCGAALRHNLLHLATHGFFAPPETVAAPAVQAAGTGTGLTLLTHRRVSDVHPGLLSGFVLAGVNRPTDPARDDGIVTAAEVETLNLKHVDLVTLSACETGLGEAAGGEGVLGLQRAFQIAGARAVIATLWGVSDEETMTLVTRFYENLWVKNRGRLEALREAQLSMVREGRNGVDFRQPYYWASFVLSGDWR